MRKIGLAILAAAAVLASCTKMDIAYENETEIGFAPTSKNVTKAGAMVAGALEEGQILGVWAFWDADGNAETVKGTVGGTPYDHYPNYTETYLNNAMFKKNGASWAGWDGSTHSPYTWPLKGALVFAGYNVPANGYLSSVTYTLNDNTATAGTDETNTMTFIGYKQSNNVDETFDLCWFERTANSYNNRNTGTAIPVTLKHALSWLVFTVKGEGAAVTSWKITKMTIKNIYTQGTGTCNTTATWVTDGSPQNMEIFNFPSGQQLTNLKEDIGSTTGIVVIPQTTTGILLDIEYKYLKPQTTDVYITETGTINLTTVPKWESGIKYTYNLTFKANEILVDPVYGDWGTDDDNDIIVE